MSSEAYHNEALRKTRVIQRKQDAMHRLNQQAGGYAMEDIQASYDASRQVQPGTTRHDQDTQVRGPTRFQRSPGQLDHALLLNVNRDRVYEVMHPEDTTAWEVGLLGSGDDDDMERHYSRRSIDYDRHQYDHSRDGPIREGTWHTMEKELRHQEKVLRNHNLVMGPLSAFKN